MAEEARAVEVRRLVVCLPGRCRLQDPAVPHDGHAVAEGHGLLAVVRDEERGHAKATLDLAHLLAHAQAQVGVQVAERLVEQQHLGAQHQGAGQGHALPLAAGDLVHPRVGLVGKVHGLKHLRRALVGLLARGAREPQAVGNVLRDGEVREERVGLEDRRGGAHLRAEVGDVGAVEKHPSGLRRKEASHKAQRSGLAASGGAKEAEHFSPVDAEGEIVYDAPAVEGLGQAGELEEHARTSS